MNRHTGSLRKTDPNRLSTTDQADERYCVAPRVVAGGFANCA